MKRYDLDAVLAAAGYADIDMLAIRRIEVIGWGEYGSLLGGIPQQSVLEPKIEVISRKEISRVFRHVYGGPAVNVARSAGLGSGSFVLLDRNDPAAKSELD
jgi:hypothetical protein